jgi:flagellar hook-associated protein 1 FlgK
MASSFGGINTALTSLYAQRYALDITGQNIANVNTEGYTRQRVNMTSQAGSIVPTMWSKSDGIGTGVAVTDVQRLRDEFLESRGRTEHGQRANLTAQTAAYSAVEDVFAEPSDTALQAQLHDMWSSWSDVSNNPSLPASRSALLEQSATVANVLKDGHEALSGQWTANRTQLDAYAAEVNTTASAVAELNSTIVQAKATGVTVNELEDQRDLQVMHLSELTGATASKRTNGAIDVFVGGSTLVSQFTTRAIQVTGASRLADQGTDPVKVSWVDTGTAAPPGGTMGAMADTMTTIIPKLSAQLDDVADKLITTVNNAQANAFDLDGNPGQPFFSGTSAADIAVAITDPRKVAASSSAGTFDGSAADALADSGSSPTGPDKAYQSMIAQLGVSAQASARRADIQSKVTLQVDASRESESGVNLDEEMTNLLTYQRGYEAAARVLTTVDSMLDQLINRTGLVGR